MNFQLSMAWYICRHNCWTAFDNAAPNIRHYSMITVSHHNKMSFVSFRTNYWATRPPLIVRIAKNVFLSWYLKVHYSRRNYFFDSWKVSRKFQNVYVCFDSLALNLLLLRFWVAAVHFHVHSFYVCKAVTQTCTVDAKVE